MIISHYICLGILFALCAAAFALPMFRWPREAIVVVCLGFNAFFLAAYLFLGLRFAIDEGIHNDAMPSADFIAGARAGVAQGVGISLYLFLSAFALVLLLLLPRLPKGTAAQPEPSADKLASGSLDV